MEGKIGLLSVAAILSLISLAGIIYPFKPFKKRWIALVSFLVCSVLVGVFAPPPESTETTQTVETSENGVRYWVTSERLNRRTCPSLDCGVVGQLFFREGTLILEQRDGWARVTEPYHASCVNERSEYIDTGSFACDTSNGIVDGRFAEWVSAEFLSQDRPPDPAADASGIEELVAGSDDFARHRTQFAETAQSLIDQRRCTEGDFREMGGWVKSSNHRNQPIYFTYCGGATVANRLYLNADTGEVFQ